MTSVTCTPPLAAPPVRLYINQLSMVPNIASPLLDAVWTAGTFSSSHLNLTAEKYVVTGKPHTSRINCARSLSWFTSLTISCVRVSLHTIAEWSEWPVFRSQTRAVSRWFVIPIAVAEWEIQGQKRTLGRSFFFFSHLAYDINTTYLWCRWRGDPSFQIV